MTAPDGRAVARGRRQWPLPKQADPDAPLLVVKGLSTHFRLGRTPVHVPDLYDTAGPYRGVLVPGVAAWALGALAYYLAAPWGGTLPALATAIVSYRLLR